MPRYIDADKLFNRMENCAWFDNADRDLSEDLLDVAPAVDVVQVVRCKDCRFYETMGACECPKAHKIEFPTREPDDFCSFGERKDDPHGE